MARIRTVKPEFWTSEQVMDLSPLARLLFLGMFNFCDDAGIHPAKSKTLKAKIFPSDEISVEAIRALVDECIDVGLVDEYEVDGELYWIVTGWHHQKIDQPTFRYPRPDGTVPEGSARRRKASKAANSANVRRTLPDHSPNAQQALDGCAPPEGKGREGKGKDKDGGPNRSDGIPPHAHEHAPATASPVVQQPVSRAVEIAVYLRQRGITGANSANPNIAGWGDDVRVTNEILDAALSVVSARGVDRPVGPNYLAPIVRDLLNPKPVQGSRDPPPHLRFNDRTANRAETIATLTGRSRTHECAVDIIDVVTSPVD